MKNLIKKQIIDYSDKNNFCFGIICPECGKIRKSTPVRFSKAGEIPKTESKKIIFEILYKREHEQALEKAAAEAANYFNLCPNCKKFVCDDCFLICEDLDVCRSCAENLQEIGEPSSFAGWKVG